jgi:putative MFS transporter
MQTQRLLNRLDTAPLGRFHIRLLLVVGICWVWAAYGVTVVGYLLPLVRSEWHIRPSKLGLMASFGMFGMMVGSVLAGALADRLGRRMTLEVIMLYVGLALALSAISWNYPLLLTLRFFTGMGLGAILPVSGTLISEYSPVKQRGRLLVLQNLFWGLGGVLAALVGYLVVLRWGWRPALLFGVLALLTVPLIRLTLPESVRFLITQRRMKEARKIVEHICVTPDGQSSDDETGSQVNEQLPVPAENNSKQQQGIWSRRYVQITSTLWVMWFALNYIFQGVFVWLPSILEAEGSTLEHSYLVSAVINLGQVPGAIIAASLADVANRRNMLILFLTLLAGSAFLFGFAQTIPLVMVLGFLLTVCNGAAWGLAYPFTTELYPTRIRGSATGWANGFGRLGGVVAPYLVGILLQRGVDRLGIFAILAAAPLLVTVTLAGIRKTTTGRSLEEITEAR